MGNHPGQQQGSALFHVRRDGDRHADRDYLQRICRGYSDHSKRAWQYFQPVCDDRSKALPTPGWDNNGYVQSLIWLYQLPELTIQDNLLDTMPTAAPLNEQWASGFVNDWPGGNNWTGRAQGSFTGVSFADRIDGEDVTIPANPMPGCGGNAALVRHWEQEWRVGSLATGVGRLVQTNTLEQHLDFGRHSNIRY